MVLLKHLPHPIPGPLRDVEKNRFKSTACLPWNMYVIVCTQLHVLACVYCTFVHECAWECVWIITSRQSRLPADPQIQTLSHRKWPPRESDEREAKRGRTGGKMERVEERENRRSEREKDETGLTPTKNKRRWEEKMKGAWDWLSGQNQHQALYLCTYWWKPFRLFLTGKCLKPNPGREREGDRKHQQHNVPFGEVKWQAHLHFLSLHINTLHIVYSLMSTLGCVVFSLELFCDHVWIITATTI